MLNRYEKWNRIGIWGLMIAPIPLTLISATIFRMNGITALVTLVFWICICMWIAWEGETT